VLFDKIYARFKVDMGVCSVCSVETSKRCVCKRFCCEQCHVKDWSKHKRECRKPDLQPCFSLPEEADAFCDFVRRNGFALVRCAGVARQMEQAVALARMFFSFDEKQKINHGAGRGPGLESDCLFAWLLLLLTFILVRTSTWVHGFDLD
jgi:hypothetical protein